MNVIQPCYLLNAILKGYKENAVIKFTKNRIDNLNKVFHNNYEIRNNIKFEDIIDFVKQLVFEKHQSIVTETEIYIKNCKELRNRLDLYCEDKIEDFILPVWDEILYEESLNS